MRLYLVTLGFATLGTALAQTAPDFRKPAGADWPLVGGDWANTRYSTLAQISPSNVKTLKGAWMARLNSGFGAPYSQQGTPVVKDGVMYITTGQQDIFALDAKTGNLIWEYRTRSDPKTPDNKAKRGVALGEGMVFGVEADIRKPAPAEGRPEPLTRMFALDQKTGKTLWTHELGEDVPKNLRQYVAAPPLYYKGLVYISVSGGDGGLRGRLTAHDAKTGKEVWRWWATPYPGEMGSETWEGDSWKSGGGAMWVQPALDSELGLIYVNTGNPWPDYNGSTRGGDNLFTCSIVALDAVTGKYRWHYQVVHHDLWDFDMPTPVILFDQTYNGQPRKALAAHSKQGWVYILDRVTGKPLVPIEEKPVPQEARQKTAPTQPIPSGDPTAPQCAEPVPGYDRGCMFTPVWTDSKIAQPSASGDWAPGAYDPQTGYLFFTTGVSTRKFSTTGRVSVKGTREYGLITALDSRTNKQIWQKEVPYLAGYGSGVLATAGGLLFHGGTDGYFRAYDSKTGDEVWRFQTGFGADAPAATYEIGGEQYVAIAAGGSRDGLREARGDLVWSFKLGGRLNPLNGPPAPPPVVTVEAPPNRQPE
ncbi:MAG TPA: PQQ-binding-like beta-propeller repeat protein [Bryobacteraceae bacterium]|jgi:alcohol dehydrogenase (cytochrome c)|nr:PQQ-binding-like beta-propeller repeat protein [Bryobacteraceae bacterium]